MFSDSAEYFTTNGSTSVDDATLGTGANQFNYSGSWGHGTDGAGLFNGTNSYSNTTGNTTSVAFSGTSVSYFAVKAPNHGIVGVSVDGGSETLVDLYASERAGNQLVWTSPTLSAGNHTLTIRVTGTQNASSSGTYGVIDRVLIGAAAAPPSPIVDDATLGSGANQFNYSGSWGHATGESGPYNGTNSYSTTTGDTVSFAFTGSSIAYYAVKGSNHGIVGVSIDGGTETLVDLYASTRAGNQLVWSSSTLSSGNHTLAIRVTGTKNASASGTYATVDRASTVVPAIVDDATLGSGANQFNYSGTWVTSPGESLRAVRRHELVQTTRRRTQWRWVQRHDRRVLRGQGAEPRDRRGVDRRWRRNPGRPVRLGARRRPAGVDQPHPVRWQPHARRCGSRHKNASSSHTYATIDRGWSSSSRA